MPMQWLKIPFEEKVNLDNLNGHFVLKGTDY